MSTKVHATWKHRAEQRGWKVPPPTSRLAQPDWNEAWVRYWVAMDNYERKVAAGDPDPGRPVQPHR